MSDSLIVLFSEKEIVDLVPALIHIRDQQTGEIIWWNAEWDRSFHFDREEFRKNSMECLKRVIHPDDINLLQFSNHFYQHKAGTNFGGTIRIKYPESNEWSWLVGISKVIKETPDGIPLETLAVFVDFTKMINTEKQIKEALHDVLRIHNGSTLDKISKREKTIIRLLLNGLDSKEIGEQLSISTHTVRTHRKNIMLKLGVRNTSELISVAKDLGI
ncbi:MAG: LuxR C-terminal-related transcriptional regulator [Chitinophagaceae bacterium]